MPRYLVYDVFTRTPFGGNQLAVFPDATMIPEGQLQAIAREFNFSEVTFVYPPEDPAHTAKVRIFTPTMEIPFAGHPTIGTALALATPGKNQDLVLELGVGPIPCNISDGAAAFTIAAPFEHLAKPDVSLVAQALGLPEKAIVTSTHPPIQGSVGLPFVMTEVRDIATLAVCAPSLAHIRQGAALHPAGMDFAMFAYARKGHQINARMFAPLDNIPEDPATGSASAALAALLTEVLDQDLTLTIHQGEAMGRPSLIYASTQNLRPVPVTISGHAVHVMEGTLVV